MSSIIKSSFVVMTEEKKDAYNQNEIDNKAELINEEALKNKEKIMSDAKNTADRIINEAKAKSQDIVNEANQKSENVIEMAYDKSKEIISEAKEEGFNQGYQDGYAQGKQVAQNIIDEANNLKREILESRKQYVDDIEEEIVSLSLDIAETILNARLDSDKELILPLIYEGIESLSLSDSLTIIVSEEDYDVVNEAKSEILARASLVENLAVRVDRKYQKGDCLIETENGTVNSSLNLQKDKIKQAILQLLQSE